MNKEDSKKPQCETENLDVVDKYAGALSWWQISVIVLISLVKLPVTWTQMNIVFIAPPIEYECIDEDVNKCSLNCTGYVYNT